MSLQEACKYIASYSPYDNVIPGGAYPHMLLTGSLHDHRVNYWEPLKYVAKMREARGDKEAKVLLLTDTAAGHFAATKAGDKLRQQAEKFAFLLETVGTRT
jgi:oligopeptidase B